MRMLKYRARDAAILASFLLLAIVIFIQMRTGLFNSQASLDLREEGNKTSEEIDLNLVNSSLLLKCPRDVILCSDVNTTDLVKSSELPRLRKMFYRLASSLDFQCIETKRFGRRGDGGYDVCMSPGIRPNKKSCLVYSFGILDDWSFDEDLARYGCEVHSFDPSIGKEDHLHAPNVHFHNLGLWGTDLRNSQGWKLNKLSTILKRLGHEQRLIDVMKVDVENAEWPFLRDVLYEDTTSLSKVKQLLIELHTPRKTPTPMTAMAFAEINAYLKRLREKFKFQLYKNVQRNYCCGGFSPIMPEGVPEKCCHESFFFNTQLLYGS